MNKRASRKSSARGDTTSASALRVVGCVMFHPDGEGGGRMLQLAVAEELRGQGIGRALVRELEQVLRQARFVWLWLQARLEVLGFYQSLGYEPEGERFVEVGLAHQRMHKRLDTKPLSADPGC